METQYDANGNLIYSKDGFDNWQRWEYDENGNLIMHEDSNGLRVRSFYENNKVIRCEFNSGYSYTLEYDERGNEIFFKDTNGLTVESEYDENNNLIFEVVVQM
jgi:YD repeat-containing protein